MIRIPTHQPRPIIGVLVIPRYRKTLLCVANSAATLAAMQEVARGGDGDYRLSWNDPRERYITRHETRERGMVTTWRIDHAARSRDERLAEIEADADLFMPMDEAEGMAA